MLFPSEHIVILKIINHLIYINVILLYTASQQLFLINSFLLFSFVTNFIFLSKIFFLKERIRVTKISPPKMFIFYEVRFFIGIRI